MASVRRKAENAAVKRPICHQPIFVEPEDYALYRDLLGERCKANGVA